MSNKQIEELEKELSELRLEFNKRATTIQTKLERIRREQERPTESENRPSEAVRNHIDFEIGDLLEITNEYRYIDKGVRGRAVAFNKSKDRVTIVDDKGKKYIRAPWNLKKV